MRTQGTATVRIEFPGSSAATEAYTGWVEVTDNWVHVRVEDTLPYTIPRERVFWIQWSH